MTQNTVKQNSSSYFPSIGFSLLFIGLPLSWMLRSTIGQQGERLFSMAMITFACLLLPNWSRVFAGRSVLSRSPVVVCVELFFLYLILWTIVSTDSGTLAFDSLLPIFLLPIVLSFSTPIDLVALPRTFACLSTCVSLLILAVEGSATLAAASTERISVGDAGSPNQVSFVGGITVVTNLFLLVSQRASPRSSPLLLIVGACAGAVVVVLTQTRSTIIGLVVCLVAILTVLSTRATRKVAWHQTRMVVLLLVAASATLVIFDFSPGQTPAAELVTTHAESLQDYFYKGYLAYFKGQDEVEVSASTRRLLRDQAWQGLSVSGHGFQSLYIDLPILQAFYDGGLVFGLCYSLVTLLAPLIIISRRLKGAATADPPMQLACITYLFYMPNLFVHGQPFDYTVLLPISTFYGVLILSPRPNVETRHIESRANQSMIPLLIRK